MVMTPDRARIVLSTPMGDNDAEAPTIGAYILALGAAVWREDEAFNGKRPFGDSGWSAQIEEALVRANLVTGYIDEDDYLIDVDWTECRRLVLDALRFAEITVPA